MLFLLCTAPPLLSERQTREGGAKQDSFSVFVDVDDIVTMSTRVAGVPTVAPVLPHPPTSATDAACVFPRQWSDDFEKVPTVYFHSTIYNYIIRNVETMHG